MPPDFLRPIGRGWTFRCRGTTPLLFRGSKFGLHKGGHSCFLRGIGSKFPIIAVEAAKVCNQKAEVAQGAGKGAEALSTDFFSDLECYLDNIFNELRSKALCHGGILR
jgi:hypothetical protein